MAYELTDDEWAKLEALLAKNKMGQPCLDLRRTLSGIKWEDRGARCRPIKLLLSAGNLNDIKSVTWLNEFFQRLKENRRFILFAAILLWLK